MTHLRGEAVKFIFLLFFCSSVFAIDFRIVGKESAVLFEKNLEANLNESLGAITIDIFERFSIPYKGSDVGILSIGGIGKRTELISDWEMKVYGWCFSVNGEVVDRLADSVYLRGQSDTVIWFYSYAHYLNGEWVGMCEQN